MTAIESQILFSREKLLESFVTEGLFQEKSSRDFLRRLSTGVASRMASQRLPAGLEAMGPCFNSWPGGCPLRLGFSRL